MIGKINNEENDLSFRSGLARFVQCFGECVKCRDVMGVPRGNGKRRIYYSKGLFLVSASDRKIEIVCVW